MKNCKLKIVFRLKLEIFIFFWFTIVSGETNYSNNKANIINDQSVSKDFQREGIDEVWKARHALISSSIFKDAKCLTVGVNLDAQDAIKLAELDTPVLNIQSIDFPDLSVMMSSSWFIR